MVFLEKIDVSVLIITYNHEAYIRKTLDSVFMQKTNFKFEVIVGEDASPDNTREILLEYKEKYGDKLILVLHDENVGASANSMSIHRKARGRYLAGVEGDDFWTDEYKLQKQYDILENNPQYIGVCHDIMSVSADGTVIRDSILNLKTDEIKNMDNWLKDGYSLHTCSIFRRNFLPLDNPDYIKLKTAEPTMGDLILFTLMYDAGDIYVLKDVMAAHRIAGANDTTSFSYKQQKNAIKYTHMFIRIMHNLEVYLDHKYDLTPRICNRIASVKVGKMLGNIKYTKNEMRDIMKALSFKWRLTVYYRMMKIFTRKIISRLRSKHEG